MTGFETSCADETATAQLAETLALALRPGDLIALEGDLGAGKTTLARALIRRALDDPYAEVPSPTFTLMQVYDSLSFGSLAHLDLYRVEDAAELDELGVEEILHEGVVLVEWPQRAQGALPATSLVITIDHVDDDTRKFSFQGEAGIMGRFARSLAIREFLDAHGYQQSTRTHLTGDASSRAYETIRHGDQPPVILMNAPAQPDGPPLRGGKPYSKIAKLAEDMRAFAGVAKILDGHGFRVPACMAQDLDQGFLLIENLGTDSIITADRTPITERYLAAAETLAAMHEERWDHTVSLLDGSTHTIPPFDHDAIMIEVDLLIQWYVPYRLKQPINDGDRQQFEAIWEELIKKLESAERSLLLRDYHSPNIIWMEGTTGSKRTGLIDFQDALIGPTAYDVASLAQDARVDVSATLEEELVTHYCLQRSPFDENQFRAAYAIMAAERATKVLGIFVRLSKRDGKHDYLAHLPRIEAYLKRSLQHPVLAEYRSWIKDVLGN